MKIGEAAREQLRILLTNYFERYTKLFLFFVFFAGKKDHDLLTDDMLATPGDGIGVNDDAGKDDMELLNEILNATSSGGVGGDDEFAQEWDSVFGTGLATTAGSGGAGTPLTPGGDLILGGVSSGGGVTRADGGLSGSMSSLSSSSMASGGPQNKAPEFLPSSLLDIGMGECIKLN